MKKAIAVNFFGGPGAGKSTQRSDVFARLKKAQFNVEEVSEYAKQLTWQKSFKVLSNQLYVFGKQHNKMFQLSSEVDVIVTDSPLLLSLLYKRHYKNTENPHFEALVRWEFERYQNINIYLDRPAIFQGTGRNQTVQEARVLDEELKAMMDEFGYGFDLVLNVDEVNVAEIIFDFVASRLNQ